MRSLLVLFFLHALCAPVFSQQAPRPPQAPPIAFGEAVPQKTIAQEKAAPPAPHLPTPPYPNCQCGCTVTGKCNCKDCDHPALSPPKKSVAAPPAPKTDVCDPASGCPCGCISGGRRNCPVIRPARQLSGNSEQLNGYRWECRASDPGRLYLLDNAGEQVGGFDTATRIFRPCQPGTGGWYKWGPAESLPYGVRVPLVSCPPGSVCDSEGRCAPLAPAVSQAFRPTFQRLFFAPQMMGGNFGGNCASGR